MKTLNPLFSIVLSTVIIAACGEKGEATETNATSTGTDSTGDTTNDTKTTSPTGPTGETEDSGGSEGGSEGGTTSTTGNDSDCNFICETDSDTGGGVEPECSVWEQDCGDGQKCVPYDSDADNSWDSAKCAEDGQALIGDPCTANDISTGSDTCAKGGICWFFDQDANGICIPMCSGSAEQPSCPEPKQICDSSNFGQLNLCLTSCNPLLNDCEGGDDLICIPGSISDGFICDAYAGAEGTVAGDPCEFINVCPKGTVCANAEGVPNCNSLGCCSSYCDLDAQDPKAGCLDGQECVPFYEENVDPPPGLENVGLCFIPQ